MNNESLDSGSLRVMKTAHSGTPVGDLTEPTCVEPIILEPIPHVGLLGMDKGSWHCGGGMGGL